MTLTTEKEVIPETQSASGPAYRVECRAIGRPIPWGDDIIGSDWRPMPTIEQIQPSIGVNGYGRIANGQAASTRDAYHALTHTHAYMGAIALAASAMCVAPFGLELRIVEYHYEISSKVIREREMPFPDMVELMMQQARSLREHKEKPKQELTKSE